MWMLNWDELLATGQSEKGNFYDNETRSSLKNIHHFQKRGSTLVEEGLLQFICKLKGELGTYGD